MEGAHGGAAVGDAGVVRGGRARADLDGEGSERKRPHHRPSARRRSGRRAHRRDRQGRGGEGGAPQRAPASGGEPRPGHRSFARRPRWSRDRVAQAAERRGRAGRRLVRRHRQGSRRRRQDRHPHRAGDDRQDRSVVRDPVGVNIDLLDPASFAHGQPHEQFRWLRDNAPVYRHPEPDGAGEMPSFVIAELLGIPLDDGRRLYHLTETIHAAPDTVPPGAGLNAIIEMFNYAHEVAENKRAHPGDDLASRILGAEVDGERLDDIDFNLFFLLLIDAGGDTTRNLVGGGLVALFDHPEERRRLQDDLDARLPSAVDEMLRWVSPVIYMRRTATQDCDLAGTPITTGDKVVMYYGSANRDER